MASKNKETKDNKSRFSVGGEILHQFWREFYKSKHLVQRNIKLSFILNQFLDLIQSYYLISVTRKPATSHLCCNELWVIKPVTSGGSPDIWIQPLSLALIGCC